MLVTTGGQQVYLFREPPKQQLEILLTDYSILLHPLISIGITIPTKPGVPLIPIDLISYFPDLLDRVDGEEVFPIRATPSIFSSEQDGEIDLRAELIQFIRGQESTESSKWVTMDREPPRKNMWDNDRESTEQSTDLWPDNFETDD